MESDLAGALAADILLDHFGPLAQRVAIVLLERGELSLQQLLRFVNEEEDLMQEPLTFIQVRNALCVLLQHNLVAARPQVQEEQGRVVPQLYSIDLEEVLSRLRFSRYLEYVECRYGRLAFQIVFSVVRQGRVARSIVLLEVQQQCEEDASNDIDAKLIRLLKDDVLRVVRPYMVDQATSSASKEEQAKTRGSKRKVPGGETEAPKGDPVYQVNTQHLNLCLVKMLLCKQYEDMSHSISSTKALATLLSEVVKSSGADEQTQTQAGDSSADDRKHGKPKATVAAKNWLTFSALVERMGELGYSEGRDNTREQTDLRKSLDGLSSQQFGIVRKRGATLRGDTNAEWRIDWEEATYQLKKSATSQLVRDRFGKAGLRIFNCLNNTVDPDRGDPQKLEATHVARTAAVEPTECRSILNSMVRSHFVKLQQVAPASNDEKDFNNSEWLYYVDRKPVELTIIRDTLQAILNLRVRARTEVKSGARLDALPVTNLTAEERRKREQRWRMQDILERSYLVMDSLLLVFGQP